MTHCRFSSPLSGLALVVALAAGPVLAQHEPQSAAGGASGPSMQMHKDMMKGAKESMGMKPSGDIDKDFLQKLAEQNDGQVVFR